MEEALRQWKLALLGSCLVSLLRSKAKLTGAGRLGTLASRVEETVLDRLREPQWLPDLIRSAEESVPTLMGRPDVAKSAAELTRAVEVLWRSAEIGRSDAAAPAGDPSRAIESFAAAFRARVAAASTGAKGSSQGPLSGRPSAEINVLNPYESARAWVRMAQVVSAWPEIVREFDAIDGDLIDDGRLTKLLAEARRLEARIAERNTLAAHSQLATPHGRRDYLLFQDTSATIRQLGEGLRELIEGGAKLHDAFAASGAYRDLVHQMNELADRAAASVPVRWLLDLIDELNLVAVAPLALLSHLSKSLAPGAEPIDLSSAGHSIQPRLALLGLVVDRLDAIGLSSEAWESIRRALPKLIGKEEGSVALLRTHQVDDRLVEIIPDDDGDPRLLRTGLSFRAEVGSQAIPLRPVTFAARSGLTVEASALLDMATWLGHGSRNAGDLSLLCVEMVKALKPFQSTEQWWAQAEDVQRAMLWRILQRTFLRLQESGRDAEPRALALLTAFEDAGFRLIPGHEASGNASAFADGPWFLDPVPASTTPAGKAKLGFVAGPILSTPSGQFGPTLWLRFAPPSGRTGALAQCVTRCEPLLATLKVKDGTAKVWEAYKSTLLELASNPAPADEADKAVALFLEFYRSGRRDGDDLTLKVYRTLAFEIFKCLTNELKTKVNLRFDSNTLDFEPLTSATAASLHVSWKPSTLERGTVLDVIHLNSRDDQPAKVVASAGQNVPDALLPWLPLFKPPEIPQRGAPLLELFEFCRKSLWSDGRPLAAEIDRIRDRFRADLDRPSGQDWFHKFAELAMNSPENSRSTRAWDWLQTLIAQGWCRVYPNPTTDSGGRRQFQWPADAVFDPSTPIWKFDKTLPRGAIIGHVERFASVPSRAVCAASLGPPDQRTPLAAAWKTREAAEAFGTNRALTDAVGRLWAATYSGGPDAPIPHGADSIARDALSALLDAAATTEARDGTTKQDRIHLRLDPRLAGQLDTVLSRLRDWSRLAGLAILPRAWTFTGRMRREDLADDEKASKLSLIGTSDGGRNEIVHIVAFGLTREHGEPSGLIAQCDLKVSTGPSPAHYEEMVRLARDSGSETGKAQVAKLREWRLAWMDDRLPAAAQDFFVDFWDNHQAKFLKEDREAAKAFISEFEQLLDKACSLKVFYPTSILNAKPNSITVRSRTGTTTGRVIEVLRPELRSGQSLRVPAIVIAE